MISKEMLLEIGRKKGLTTKEHIEKDYFQDVFLFSLSKNTNKFIFKGGTSLYKLYALPRFSEDLDFSLLSLDVKSAEDIIKNTIKGTDCLGIKSVKKTKDSLLVKIACKGILTRYNSLRIDVNFKNRVLEGFDVKNYVPDYIDINPFSLRAMKLEEIISEKIHAVFMREKARDIFDLFFLLRISRFDKKLVEEKLNVFNIKYNARLLENKIRGVEDVWENELRAFILTELPEFNMVRDFVLSKIKAV